MDNSSRIFIYELCIDGVLTPGEAEKQWFLEAILEYLGFDIEKEKREYESQGFKWSNSINS